MSKRKKKAIPGKVIKISQELYRSIRGRSDEKKSMDSLLRFKLGLPSRKGDVQKFRKFWILRNPTVKVFDKLKDARGEAVLRAVRGGSERVERPMKLREIR